jgi:hypothetical protein
MNDLRSFGFVGRFSFAEHFRGDFTRG